MGLRFIFMLTRNDRTVPDASQQLQTALSLGVRHIGFKDIGLPLEQLKGLNAAIKAGSATSYLEVVSLDRESEIVSAKAAAEIGVDVLLGGTRVDDVLPIIKGTGIQYFPFPGRITGHPSVLEGDHRRNCRKCQDDCGARWSAWPGPVGVPFGGERARVDEGRLRCSRQACLHCRFDRHP